jgi:hypothetical protein
MRLATALKIVVVASVAAAAATAAGCSTDNGDAAPPDEVPAPTGSRERDAGAARPEFDATFPDDADDAGSGRSPDASGDASPDGSGCADTDDPGGAENVAKILPPMNDCDEKYKSVMGVVQSAVDVDFYKLSASDETFCSLDTDFEVKTAGTELCVFMRCKNSTIDAVTGCAQGAASTSDLGLKGCCTSGPGHAVPTWDCSGLFDDDSADIVLRVKPEGAASCLPYELGYRF